MQIRAFWILHQAGWTFAMHVAQILSSLATEASWTVLQKQGSQHKPQCLLTCAPVMQFVMDSLIADTSEGFQTHTSGFNNRTLSLNHEQFSCENLQANAAFHTLGAAVGWCPDCAVFSTDTDDICNDWQQKEWKETRQERISMFCTKPGTKTQLVYLTFLCVKQQISTSPRETQSGGTFRDALALLTQRLLLQCWGMKHSLLSIPLTTCTQRLSPGHGSLLLPQPCMPFSYTIQPQPPWCLPHICRAGCKFMPQSMNCPATVGGKKWEAQGCIPMSMQHN